MARLFRRRPARCAAIDLPTIQKHLNHWFSESVDLHGSEVSSNAATYFGNGLKGRAKEDNCDEHRALHQTYQVTVVRRRDGFDTRDVPLRNAMNEVLRDWYIGDCEAGVARGTACSSATGSPTGSTCPRAASTADRHLRAHTTSTRRATR